TPLRPPLGARPGRRHRARPLAHRRALRIPARRARHPRRRPPSRLGLRRLSPGRALLRPPLAPALRHLARRVPLLRRPRPGRRAQLIAAAAAVPFCLGGGALMQYVSFDYLAWALAAYCALRLFAGGNPRWWLAIGAAVGFGMLSKYTMPMLAAGLGLGVLATPWRKQLKSPWLWAGVGVALLVFAPNL